MEDPQHSLEAPLVLGSASREGHELTSAAKWMLIQAALVVLVLTFGYLTQ